MKPADCGEPSPQSIVDVKPDANAFGASTTRVASSVPDGPLGLGKLDARGIPSVPGVNTPGTGPGNGVGESVIPASDAGRTNATLPPMPVAGSVSSTDVV